MNKESSNFFMVIFDRKSNLKTTTKTTTKIELILDIVKENKYITAKEIAEKLNITEEGVRYHLKNMKKRNLIDYIGSAKGGHWEIMNDE